MDAILTGYAVNEPTWFYLSLLLILAVFFKFNRLWSLRNLDLALLLSLSPGLLFVRSSQQSSPFGYSWLLAVTGLILLRVIVDPFFSRRPRLEQNLNPAGMWFLCLAALAFQVTRVCTEEPHSSAVEVVRKAVHLHNREDSSATLSPDQPAEVGPASALLAASVVPWTGGTEATAARALAILAHLGVVLGLIAIGRWHFADTNLGLAMGTLYLLLPCTAYDVSKVNHLLPAALTVWAFAYYQRPVIAGILLGLACGALFFPFFLLPVWVGFYWNRGVAKFTGALVSVAALLLGSLLLTSADSHSLTRQILGSIDWSVLKFGDDDGVGFWSLYDPAYRIPVFALFAIGVVSLSIWPLHKNLEHLIANSTAIIVGIQFWYPHQGGVYVLWYVPLLLMVVFRPRLVHLWPQDDSSSSTGYSLANPPVRRPMFGGTLQRTQFYR